MDSGSRITRVQLLLASIAVIGLVLGVTGLSGAADPSSRITVRGMHYAVAAGHPLASKSGTDIMDKGGNAVDAGVAVLLCQAVLEQSHFTLGGEGGILIYLAKKGKMVLINGMGIAPKVATIDYYMDRWGELPIYGLPPATVPGFFDAMVVALDQFGTKSFEEVAQAAYDLSAKGFPMYRTLSNAIKSNADKLEKWQYSAAAFLPGGKVPQPGEIFKQPDLAKTFEKLIEAEKNALAQGKNRSQALTAVRDVFYKGDIALTIDKFMREHEKEGGLLRYEDFAHYKAKVEEPWSTTYRGYTVYSQGTWSQGPAMLQALNILEGYDIKSLGQNSPESLHLMIEAVKLALADRHKHYGDPDFVKVPKAGLLSKGYATVRGELIKRNQATPEFEPGDPWKFQGMTMLPKKDTHIKVAGRQFCGDDPYDIYSDTTTMALVDKDRNVFSSTPSTYGGMSRGACIPGDVGFLLNTRGAQFGLDPNVADHVEPWKRPRMTPSTWQATKDGKPFMAWGTPCGDCQVNTMIQLFLNIVEFGMSPQDAHDSPRFRSYAFPSGRYPQASSPNDLRLEGRLPAETIEGLEAKGHKVQVIGNWSNGSGVSVYVDPANPGGPVSAAADQRREKYYAIGW